MLDIGRFRVRILVFLLLLGVPIARLILDEQYGLFHVEVAAILAVVAAAAAILAAVTSKPAVFHTVTAVLVILLSVNAVQKDLMPNARARFSVAAVIAAVTAMVFVLRRNFYPLLIVFVAGGFIVDAGKALFESRGAEATAVANTPERHNHVFHILLDEMLGTGGMPADCANCMAARGELERVFEQGHFRLYPYAFSNYARTVDSIPSILNNRLLRIGGEMFDWNRGRHVLHENSYFDGYVAKGYAIRVYQSDYLIYSAPKYSAVARNYKANSLKALHASGLEWPARARQILAIFFASDSFWSETWSRVAPAPFHIKPLRVGPLAHTGVWPDAILSDVRNARKKSLFFVHLLVPHYPYVYKADGSLRKPSEWDDRLVFHRGELADYKSHYESYGEQVRFLTRQLASFLDELRALGLYDSSTIVIHGDHGSRLRLVNTPQDVQEALEENRIPRDIGNLISLYSTLLAVKLPGAAAPEVINTKRSVLSFLRQDLNWPARQTSGAMEPDIDAVYVYDRAGKQTAIPLPELWESCCTGGTEVTAAHERKN